MCRLHWLGDMLIPCIDTLNHMLTVQCTMMQMQDAVCLPGSMCVAIMHDASAAQHFLKGDLLW